MAILESNTDENNPYFHNVDKFLNGLSESSAAVAQLKNAGEHVANAFLLTPTLAVVPNFALNSKQSASVSQQSPYLEFPLPDGKQLRLSLGNSPDIIWIPTEQLKNGVELAIFNIEPDERLSVLSLFRDTAEVGQFSTIIHNPSGALRSFSIGNIIKIESAGLHYDMNTQPGSSGAPVLDANWRLLGIHIGSSPTGKNYDSSFNWGLSTAAILKVIRNSDYWNAVRNYHHILDITPALKSSSITNSRTVTTDSNEILIKAAVNASLEKETLSPEEIKVLAPYIPDTSVSHWRLRTKDRKRILKGFANLESLKPYVISKPEPPISGEVLDVLLSGPPYNLNDRGEEFLSWYSKMSRWFVGINSAIPTTAELSEIIDKQKLRNSLQRVVGKNFVGREKELKKITHWFNKNPGLLMLSGVGGIGKSAIVAHFLLQMPDLPIFWLDFDRPDLAPDDAGSIIQTLNEAAEQHWNEFPKVSVTNDDWETAASKLGSTIESLSSAKSPPILVIDSFEAAQYSQRYMEIWPVLNLLSRKSPSMRIIVTGRAPVSPPKNFKRKSVELILRGFDEPDTHLWLEQHGIQDNTAQKKLTDLTRGVPLKMRLALRYIKEGGDLDQIPEDLPHNLVAGYLHGRVLDRIQTPDIRPLAGAVLVLRRVTADLLRPIFSGLIELPAGEPEQWIEELSREMSLVDGENVLTVRPEVRSETLWLLEHDDKELVENINRLAEKWYANLNSDEPRLAAELVYHRLRLGDLQGAEDAWQIGCSIYFDYSVEDLRDEEARTWLNNRLAATSNGLRVEDNEIAQAEWENQTALEIQNLYLRSNFNHVSGLLSEREERIPNGQLLVYDAVERIQQNKLDDALELLERNPNNTSDQYFVRNSVVQAWVYSQVGQTRKADQLLRNATDRESSFDEEINQVHSLASIGSRIELTINQQLEERLLLEIESTKQLQAVSRILTPKDVANPYLRRLLAGIHVHTFSQGLESRLPFINLGDPSDRKLLFKHMTDSDILDNKDLHELRHDYFALIESNEVSDEIPFLLKFKAFKANATKLEVQALKVAVNGWRRIHLMCFSQYFDNVLTMGNSRSDQYALVSKCYTLADYFTAYLKELNIAEVDLYTKPPQSEDWSSARHNRHLIDFKNSMESITSQPNAKFFSENVEKTNRQSISKVSSKQRPKQPMFSMLISPVDILGYLTADLLGLDTRQSHSSNIDRFDPVRQVDAGFIEPPSPDPDPS